MSNRIVLAYVSSGSDRLVDADLVTHINYAFGTVGEEFNSVNVQHPERLRAIVALKKQNPNLKVMLSIGGWGSGGFSEMAREESLRGGFVAHCGEIVKDFAIDGIDIDWEYPSCKWSGIKACEDDIDNFTLLMRELRQMLGHKKLLTFATSASGRFIDFEAVMPYCDFVNIMAYDMGRPPHHNAALFPSDKSRMSVQQAIDAHLAKGISSDKLVLGMPLYGHGNKNEGVSDYVDNSQMYKFKDHIHLWDSVACVPYVVNEQGAMIVSYDSAKSLELKCAYALDRGLRGVMYWEYSCDNEQLELVKATYNAVFKKN
ncbi:MAG: glycosyl hydrolase family 18 protein [Mucinivorans sp.]